MCPLSTFLCSPSQYEGSISSHSFLMPPIPPGVTLRPPQIPASESMSRYTHLLGQQHPPGYHAAKRLLDCPGDHSIFLCLKILPSPDFWSVYLLKLSHNGSYAPHYLDFAFTLICNISAWSFFLVMSSLWLRYCASADWPDSIRPCLDLNSNGCTANPSFSYSNFNEIHSIDPPKPRTLH